MSLSLSVTRLLPHACVARSQSDLFYDGKNLESVAKLQLRAAQFAQSFTIERVGTFDQVLGEIGGFEGLMLMLIGLFAGVISLCIRFLSAERKLVVKAAELSRSVPSTYAPAGAALAPAEP